MSSLSSTTLASNKPTGAMSGSDAPADPDSDRDRAYQRWRRRHRNRDRDRFRVRGCIPPQAILFVPLVASMGLMMFLSDSDSDHPSPVTRIARVPLYAAAAVCGAVGLVLASPVIVCNGVVQLVWCVGGGRRA